MSEFLKTQLKENKRELPPQERPRNWKGFFPKNRNCLSGIKRSYKNYYLVINELCENYNMLHGSKTRFCSVATSRKRINFYREFFSKVCKEFRIDPRDLKPKHIDWFFRNYIVAHLKKDQTTKYVKNNLKNLLSFLQFFCRMIGKHGIVQPYTYYLELVDPTLDFDAPPTSKGQGISEEKVNEILFKAFKLDLLLGCQLLAMFAFGLRDQEACGIKPCTDFVDKAEASETRRYLTLRPKAGSKGGRPRAIPLTNEFQLEVETLLVRICQQNGYEELRNPNLNLRQAVTKLTHDAERKLGFNLKNLGITPYAFRHSFAQTYFDEILKSGLDQKDGLKSTSLALGHYREGITGVYLNNKMRAGNEAMQRACKRLLSIAPKSLEAVYCISSLIREIFFHDWKLGLAMGCLFADPESDMGKNPVIGVVIDIVYKDDDIPSVKELIEGVSTKLELDPKDFEEVICCHGGSIDIKALYKNAIEQHFAKIVE